MKFSQFPQQVIDENVDYTVKEITNIIKKYGPRESGNSNVPGCREAHSKKRWTPSVTRPTLKATNAPKAFCTLQKSSV